MLGRLLLLAALVGCAPRFSIPEDDRHRAVAELSGERRFLRVAVFAEPFPGDGTKLLVHDAPPGELPPSGPAAGEAARPSPGIEILLPGTPVRVRSLEFPTGVVIAKRAGASPRTQPWVLLEIPGRDRPAVLVLSQASSSYDDLRAEIDRVLAAEDPGAAFRSLPQAQRDAIARKEPLEGMSPRALEMAWGFPEKKIIDLPGGSEEWSWAGGRRRAFVRGERLLRWERR